jgi:anti-sigma regulatory factor (Ser/Thr protein kinase)
MNFLEERPEIAGKVIYEEKFASTKDAKNSFLEEGLFKLREEAGLSLANSLDARLVLDELIGNAMNHGNKGDASKHVTVTLYAADGGWVATIEDEGSGFDPKDLNADFDAIELTATSGRGIALVEMYAKGLSFFNGGRGAYVMFSTEQHV